MREIEGVDPWAAYRPKGHTLMLLLRAAVIPAGNSGPWLTLARSYSTQPRRVFLHHISLSDSEEFSPYRLTMCSGIEALGFAFEHRWPSVTDPTLEQLRALGDWCVDRALVPLWDTDREAWVREYMGPKQKERRASEAANGEAHARVLRWELAERWFRQ